MYVMFAARGVLKMSNPPPPTNNSAGQGFAIFSDENAKPAHVAPPQTGDWASVPTKEKVNRENEKKAGKWSNQKVSYNCSVLRACGIIMVVGSYS